MRFSPEVQENLKWAGWRENADGTWTCRWGFPERFPGRDLLVRYRIISALGWRRYWFPDAAFQQRFPGLESFSAADSVLSEFYGLRCGVRRPGINFAQMTVMIDPAAASLSIEELRAFETEAGSRLFPVGAGNRDDFDLLIDDKGRTYMSSYVAGELQRIAPNFDRTLESLLLGLRIPEDEMRAAWP